MNASDFERVLGKNQDDQELSKIYKSFAAPNCSIVGKRTYWDYPLEGIQLVFNEDHFLSSVFLYSENYKEHRAFGGELPNGILFSQSRSEVRSRFPELFKSGGGDIGVLGRPIKFWDKFFWREGYAHVEYSDNLESVELVTLSKDVYPVNAANPPKLIITPIPSLISVLLNKEKEKGSSLTEEDVISIREKAVCVMLPEDKIRSLEETRGYRDVDIKNTWTAWLKFRGAHGVDSRQPTKSGLTGESANGVRTTHDR